MDNTNHKILETQGLTFDDVLLLPNYTDTKREDIDLSSLLTSKIKLALPILSSPMDTVTEYATAIALGKIGGLGVIHRNMSVVEQVEQVKKVVKEHLISAAAVGVGKDLEERTEALVKAGVNVLFIDSAHGFSKWVIEATRFISGKYKNVELVSGNVATAAGAKALIEAGAKGVKVGMGPGSICTTRIVSGMGVPQMSAVMEAAAICRKYSVPVISDGGVRYSGDVVKALAGGASSVMMGSLFAGCSEAPGEIRKIKNKSYKIYRGMGSVSAMKEGSDSRYGQQYRRGQEKKLTAEGVEGLVEYLGNVEDVTDQLIGGLRTGMYYVGVKNIHELQDKTRFVKITQASLTESHPHDIVMK